MLMIFANAQAQNSTQSLPDFSKWEKETMDAHMIYRDQEVTFNEEVYYDAHSGLVVVIIYDEKKNPWLAFFSKRDSNPIQFLLFENREGKWMFVNDFTNSEDLYKETNDFLKAKYDLSFKTS